MSIITTGYIRSADDLTKERWFKGFESQLDGAMQQAKEMYRAATAQAPD